MPNKFQYCYGYKDRLSMSSVQAESVIKSIIREIGTECSSRGVEASETLIAFTVKAAVLDPDNAFNVERALTKVDVQQLIQVIIYYPYQLYL